MGIILRERKLKSRKTSFYLEYNLNGKKKFEFLKIDLGEKNSKYKEERKLAEAIRDQRKLDYFYSSNNLPNKSKTKINLVEYYLKNLQLKPPDRPSWTNSYLKLKQFTNGKIRFNQVTVEWLEEYKNYLLSKVSQNTAHHYFANLSTVFNQAVKDGIIDNNILKRVNHIPKKDVKREFLLDDDIKKLIKTDCKVPETKRAFLFSCYTGLRFSDVKNLTWGNIKNDQIEFRQIKTNNVEYLPLHKDAKKLLFENSSNNIIPIPMMKVFNLPSKSYQNSIIKKWVKSAGINKNISFHSARHTFATLALTYGANIYTVSKLLGHKDIMTTQIYAKIIDKKKIQAVDAIPNFL
ncbi:MAG: site-specific integrase [Ignavibacteriae bacterium]|nr:site-specific integrase [Ignavibacteriota bacterium]